MKVLYLISGTNMGGATLSFLTLIRFMKEKGEEPYVVIPDDDSTFTKLLDDSNIPFFIAPIPFFCYPKERKGIKYILHLFHMFIRELIAEHTLNRIVNKIKPDFIHTNVGPLAAGHFIAKKREIPHIWHIREYADRDFNIHFFPSKKYFQKIIAQDITISITQDLLKYNKLENNKKAFAVYNGVRNQHEIYFNSNKEKYFLCASRISPEKNHTETISVFSLFYKKHPEYKLIILGDGDVTYINHLKRQCFSLGCHEAVEFKGFSHNVSDYMRKAKALLVTSYAEGFGRMTAEACFDGCIVIGRDSCGTKEILSQTGGFLYKTQEEMFTAMEGVASLDSEKYRFLVEKAQKKAQELFSIEQYTHNIYSIYKQTLNITYRND